MSAAVIAFFNNKGGVGKTSLVYHLACMYADFGRRVLVADLDPQANLTAAVLDEAAVERLWRPRGSRPAGTVRSMLAPLIEGTGDIAPTRGHVVNDNLVLLPGDLALSGFEDCPWPHSEFGRSTRQVRIVVVKPDGKRHRRVSQVCERGGPMRSASDAQWSAIRLTDGQIRTTTDNHPDGQVWRGT